MAIVLQSVIRSTDENIVNITNLHKDHKDLLSKAQPAYREIP